MFKSPFLIEKKIIVVSDAFSNQYIGGAELTLDALIEKLEDRYSVIRINSQVLNEKYKEIFSKYKNEKWLFGNIVVLNSQILQLIPYLISDYSILECDYKYCKYRSEELHFYTEKKQCDCKENKDFNGLISTFFSRAKNILWMSEGQKLKYERNIEIYNNVNQIVISSIFSKDHINYMSNLNNNPSIKRSNNYVILKSPSWIKGYKSAKNYCLENNLKYEEVWGLQYAQLLLKLRSSKGLVYLPLGDDTCPRIVIESKLLGCDLILNKHVQHKEEEWFKDHNSILNKFKNQEKILKELF
tara:strand:+ start:1369 stop:2265 length:897 start_codon:yes stop_codon:yes gene_type:complete